MSDLLAIGQRVSVERGSWSECAGIVTHRSNGFVFVRLDGEQTDLCFAADMLAVLEPVERVAGARLL